MSRRTRLALLVATAGIVLAAAAGGVVLLRRRALDAFATTPFGSDEIKLVEVPRGARLREAATALASAGVVSDASKLERLGRELKKDRQLKAGEYEFSGPLLPEKVLEVLAAGRVKLHRCTVPEGLRSDEIAALLEGCGFGPAAEYLRLVRDPATVQALGVKADSLEGYLFPDTYSFPKAPRPQAVLTAMVAGFRRAWARADAQRKPGVEFTEHQAATLASIVEKETAVPDERPRISCVFHNRLARNMRLETDPTVVYAKILRTGSFDGDIKRADLEFKHPYNTYTVKGLPPGPIANAGGAALSAALAPLECDDLFFVACGGGRHEFCPDFACHQANVRRCQLGK